MNRSESRVYLSGNKDYGDLFHKGKEDQARHKQKIKEAVKNSLPEIIGNEDIITGNAKKIIKVPVKGIEIPRFRFGDPLGGGEGSGKGKKPGDQPGVDYYEVDYDLDEITQLLFEDLGLPYLLPKGREIESEEVKFNEVARKGIMPNVDKRRTIKENIKRNIMEGRQAKFGNIKPEDLRYKVAVPVTKQDSSAVVIAMRDVSGSMGEFEKYITRASYFWMVKFLRTKYTNVEIAFITHHVQAKEVDEKTFFDLGESGGTKVSSAYRLAKDIISERYNPALWNIYPFHFSDGDNWGDADNQLCLSLIQDLLKVSNMFGYAEIRENGAGWTSTLMTNFSGINNPRFISSIIKEKSDIYPTLKRFFAKENVEGSVSRL